jgi:hypothetical protein
MLLGRHKIKQNTDGLTEKKNKTILHTVQQAHLTACQEHSQEVQQSY